MFWFTIFRYFSITAREEIEDNRAILLKFTFVSAFIIFIHFDDPLGLAENFE